MTSRSVQISAPFDFVKRKAERSYELLDFFKVGERVSASYPIILVCLVTAAFMNSFIQLKNSHQEGPSPDFVLFGDKPRVLSGGQL